MGGHPLLRPRLARVVVPLALFPFGSALTFLLRSACAPTARPSPSPRSPSSSRPRARSRAPPRGALYDTGGLRHVPVPAHARPRALREPRSQHRPPLHQRRHARFRRDLREGSARRLDWLGQADYLHSEQGACAPRCEGGRRGSKDSRVEIAWGLLARRVIKTGQVQRYNIDRLASRLACIYTSLCALRRPTYHTHETNACAQEQC